MNYRYHPLIAIGLFLLLGAVFVAGPVAAQDAPPDLATWDVQVWPEYDDPAVLVIATGSLVTDTVYPQRLRIPLPAGARVNAVAYPEASGNLLAVPWTTESTDAGQAVVFDLNQPRFVVEYYADILTPPPGRSFALDLAVPYAARRASLALRQPARSSDLQTTPAMVAGGIDDLGNPTYTLELGPLAAGQSVPLQVSYTKPDADPTVARSAAPPPAADVDGGQNWLPLIVGIAAGLLVGAVILYLLMRRRRRGESRQTRRRDARKRGATPERSPAPDRSAAPAAGADKFCVQCGQKFENSDRFCRNCGAVRR